MADSEEFDHHKYAPRPPVYKVANHPVVFKCEATGIDCIDTIRADYRALLFYIAGSSFTVKCFCGGLHKVHVQLRAVNGRVYARAAR